MSPREELLPAEIGITHLDNDIAVAIEAGKQIGKPAKIGDDLYAVLNPITGTTEVFDTNTLSHARERTHDALPPQRKKGELTLTTPASFINYVLRHGGEGTELWASLEYQSIKAVLNGDAPDTAGHRDHKATLALRKTTAWKLWEELNGKLIDQEAFAGHIEARTIDIISPTGAELLDLVQSIRQTTKSDFESAKRLSDGQTVLEYRETTTATAGTKGEYAIPEQFSVALAPFEGVAPYQITAHLRTRVKDSKLALGFVLERPQEVLEAAFTQIRELVEGNLPQHPMFEGSIGYRY